MLPNIIKTLLVIVTTELIAGLFDDADADADDDND